MEDDGQQPMVSIVLAIRNEESTLRRCMASIVRQDYPSQRMEVLVAEGRSDDGSREIAEDFAEAYPFVRVLDNRYQTTPAGLNVAIRESCGEVIVRVDGHTVLEPDYVRQCIKALEGTGANNVGGPMRPQAAGWVAEAIALAMTTPFCLPSQVRQTDTEGYVESVYMGAFRRDVFDRVGLFNEDLIRNQDYELNYRIREAGGTIYQTPAIKSWYLSRGSIAELWRQFFDYGFWKVQMIKEHPASIRPRHLVPPTFVSALIVSVLLSLVFPLLQYVFAFIALSYAGLALFFSALLIREEGGLRYLPLLLLIFLCVHIAWGLGFLVGVPRGLYYGSAATL